MDNQLFRQKSLNRISSPEELHDYMRVTSPKLWMILGAIAVLLIGFIVYASTATMENTLPIRVDVQVLDNTAENPAEGADNKFTYITSRLPMSYLDTVKTGMKVRIGTEEGRIDYIVAIDEENEISLIFKMEHETIPLPEGTCDADLVLESTTPISFLWN